ncbi:MAG: alpha/beta fold hydrolase [Candidatus Sumerlaeia bacterium]
MKHTWMFWALFILLLCVSVGAQDASLEIEPLGICLESVEYPFPVSFHEFESQDHAVKMAYMDVKPEGNPEGIIVLLHGKNFNGAYWGRTARDLREAGWRIIIPDQLGFGKSSKPLPYQYSFHQLAQNTSGLLDALDVDSAVILGHSMGGMVASRFALMYPERSERLVLVNPIGLEDWKALGVPYRDIDFWYERELNKSAEAVRAYQLDSYYDGKWKPEYDRWVELLVGMTKSPEYPIMAKTQALTYDMIFTQPVVHEFGRLSMPTLLIIGTRDRTALGKGWVDEDLRAELGRYDRLGRETARAIPQASLVELEGIGHMPHIEAYPRYIKPLQAFLSGKQVPGAWKAER